MEDVTLEFASGAGADRKSLSGAATHGDFLFAAPDEGASIVRLRRDRDSWDYRDEMAYPIEALVSLPGGPGSELDLEGMDIANGSLWLAGSHSAVRTRIKDETRHEEIPDLLAAVKYPVSRRLLARIPLTPGKHGPIPSRIAGGPEDDTTAASLTSDGGGLHAILRKDEHLGPFIDLPGKDNGLDIEGLAALDGGRVLLGLRGPVLRGWAVILEIEPRSSPDKPESLVLEAIEALPSRGQYIKHFVDLRGLGIRDLARHNDDLLLLTGPTMVLDGPSRILRLRNGARAALSSAITADQLRQVGDDLTVGENRDHPEALTVIDADKHTPRLLVLYDSPSANRTTHRGVRGDLLPLN
ncbi:DUF3616 domain-containing protein [Rhodococcus koreensis]